MDGGAVFFSALGEQNAHLHEISTEDFVLMLHSI